VYINKNHYINNTIIMHLQGLYENFYIYIVKPYFGKWLKPNGHRVQAVKEMSGRLSRRDG